VFILDTDTITRHQNAHTVLSARVSSMPATRLFTTSVTVEEQLKGRLSYLNTHRNDPRKSAQGHAALVRTVYYFNQSDDAPNYVYVVEGGGGICQPLGEVNPHLPCRQKRSSLSARWRYTHTDTATGAML